MVVGMEGKVVKVVKPAEKGFLAAVAMAEARAGKTFDQAAPRLDARLAIRRLHPLYNLIRRHSEP